MIAILALLLSLGIALVASVLAAWRPDIVELFGAIAGGGLSRVLLVVSAAGIALLVLGIRPDGWRRQVGVLSVCLLSFAVARTLWHDFAAYSRQRVEFVSDGSVLVGTLFRPRGPGPFPALVLVHGSGRLARGPYDLAADRLVRMGFVVLNADKRGVGESAGTYRDGSSDIAQMLTERSRDVVAAVALLAHHVDVQHAAIGLWTVSQGGWVAPLAARATPDIAFVVNISGPATSTGEEDAFSTLADDESDHFGYRPPPIPFAEIEQRMQAVAPSGFDPAASLRELRVPSLWLFGAWDNSLPVQRSVRNLEALRLGGLPITVRVFDEANHGLMVARGPHRGLIPRFAPGVWDTMSSWLRTTSRNASP